MQLLLKFPSKEGTHDYARKLNFNFLYIRDANVYREQALSFDKHRINAPGYQCRVHFRLGIVMSQARCELS